MRVDSWLPPLGTLAFAVAIVGILLLRDPATFGVDDALNAYLPYYAEGGRLLESGQLPLLTTRAFDGGSFLVSFDRAPIHPIALATAIVTASGADLRLVAIGFAVVVTWLVALGGYLLGRALRLGAPASALIGGTIATGPIFLAIYATDWYNAAIGTVALVWSLAALIAAARRPTGWRLFSVGLATTQVMIAGWPHAMLSFVIVLIVGPAIALVQLRGAELRSTIRRWVPVAAAVAAGALLGVPALSEYLVVSGLTVRNAGIGNSTNTGVPPLAQLLGVATPFSGDYSAVFGTYRYWYLPLGFVSTLVVVAAGFVVWDRALLRDRRLQWSIGLAAVFALASQLPERVEAFASPFRFVPIMGIFVIIAVATVLDSRPLRWTTRRFLLTCSGFALLSAAYLARLPSPRAALGLYAAAAVVLGLVVLGLWLLRRPAWRGGAMAGLAVVGALSAMLWGPSLGSGYFLWSGFDRNLAAAADPPAASAGFVLHVAAGSDYDNGLWPGLSSGRYLLTGSATIGGYDPVGHRPTLAVMPQITSHGLLSVQAVAYLAGTSAITGECRFTDYRITAVVTPVDPQAGRHADLERCGYRETRDDGAHALFERPQPIHAGTQSTASPGVTTRDDELVSETVERVAVVNGTTGVGTVAFARQWWPGYSATLDGEPIPLHAEDGVLVAVEVPAGSSGTLELRYFPTSWGWALPVAGAGAIAIAALAIATARRTRSRACRRSRAESSSRRA